MSMPVPTQSQLAIRAYDAYRRVTNGKDYRGDPLPDFEDLGLPIQNAWIAVATEVRDAVLALPES